MTVSLKLPPQLDAKLKAGAARKRISKSAYMRNLLEKGVKREKVEPSAYDLIKDCIGSFSSGKRDVATNPKYMKGFGEWKR